MTPTDADPFAKRDLATLKRFAFGLPIGLAAAVVPALIYGEGGVGLSALLSVFLVIELLASVFLYPIFGFAGRGARKVLGLRAPEPLPEWREPKPPKTEPVAYRGAMTVGICCGFALTSFALFWFLSSDAAEPLRWWREGPVDGRFETARGFLGRFIGSGDPQ